MNITSLTPSPVSMSGSNSTIGTAVLAKSLDTFEQSGEGLIKMMELSVNPDIGSNIDIRV